MKAGTIIFSRELIADVWNEVQPMLLDHYAELTWRKDKFTLDPDYERYQRQEAAGGLRCYMMRRDGIVVGYAAYIVTKALHYRTVLMATNDVLYVSPEERGSEPIRFIRWCEEQLRAEGVQCISLHIKRCMDWGKLADRLGYEMVETNHLKWIGG